MPTQYDDNEPDDEIHEPGLIVLGINYTRAIARWISEGRPIRDAEEITRIFHEICSPCPYFNEVRQTCKICGCRTRRSGSALMNKIAMKTESCPKQQW